MLKWIIIILLLGIVALCTWRGYKDGIIRSVCGILALIISLYAAGIVAKMYNEEFDGMLSPFISGMVDSSFDKVLYDDDEVIVHISDADKKDVYKLCYSVSRQMGLVDAAAELMAGEMAEEYGTVNQQMCSALADKLCAKLAYIAIYCISFIVIAIVFTVIGNVINVSLLIPKLGIIEPIAGAVLGLIRGIILMYAVAMFLRYLGILLPDGIIEGTKFIFKVVNDNPVAKKIGI